jgi:hypothetical protein
MYSAAPVAIDQVVSDFDGVTFHISTPESKTKILISISLRCFNELVKYGAQSVLEREYGPYIVASESGYDFSVQVDLEKLPQEQGMRQFSIPLPPLTAPYRCARRPHKANIITKAKCHGCTF